MTARRRLVAFGAVLAVSLLLSSAQAQQVWVVDDQLCCNADFATVKEAVDAAADGDIVLVKGGFYQGLSLIDLQSKSLSIIGDGAAPQLFLHRIHGSDLGPDQAVLFRNIHFLAVAFTFEDCEGGIWFEDCILEAGLDLETGTVAAVDCDQLVFTRSTVIGLAATSFGTPGADALHATNCRTAFYDSLVLGGSGDATLGTYRAAGHATEFHGGFLFASETHFEGGGTRGWPGGDGLRLRSGQPEAHTLGCTFVGGAGSPPGEPIRIDSGTHGTLDGTPRHFRMSTHNRYGSTMSLAFEGAPFDLVYLPHNFGPGFDWQRANRGVLLLDPTRLLNFRIGFLPSSGKKTLQVVTPDLPGLQGLNFYAQGWFLDVDGLTHSAPSVATLLDPAF